MSNARMNFRSLFGVLLIAAAACGDDATEPSAGDASDGDGGVSEAGAADGSTSNLSAGDAGTDCDRSKHVYCEGKCLLPGQIENGCEAILAGSAKSLAVHKDELFIATGQRLYAYSFTSKQTREVMGGVVSADEMYSDGETLYAGGDLLAIVRDGQAKAEIVYNPSSSFTDVRNVSVHDGYLYFAVGSDGSGGWDLYRKPLSGGEAALYVPDVRHYIFDDGKLFALYGELRSFTLPDVTTAVKLGTTTSHTFCVNDTYAYWREPYYLQQVPRAGGAAVKGPDVRYDEVALCNENADYFASYEPRGKVGRLAKGASSVTDLYKGGWPTSILEHEGYLYIATGQHSDVAAGVVRIKLK